MTGNKSLSYVITIIIFGLCCAIGIVAYDQFINTTKTDIAKSNAKTLRIWLEKHRSINQISHLSGSELCVNLDANGCLADQLSAALKSGNLINIKNPFQLGSEAPLVVFGKYKGSDSVSSDLPCNDENFEFFGGVKSSGRLFPSWPSNPQGVIVVLNFKKEPKEATSFLLADMGICGPQGLFKRVGAVRPKGNGSELSN